MPPTEDRKDASNQKPDQAPADQDSEDQSDQPSTKDQQPQIEELLLDAAEAELPSGVLTLPFAMQHEPRPTLMVTQPAAAGTAGSSVERVSFGFACWCRKSLIVAGTSSGVE